jgi:hypothetical protein
MLFMNRKVRLRKTSIAALVDSAIRNWLPRSTADPAEANEKRRLHKSVAASIGALAGRDPLRAETSRQSIRQRLGRRYAR